MTTTSGKGDIHILLIDRSLTSGNFPHATICSRCPRSCNLCARMSRVAAQARNNVDVTFSTPMSFFQQPALISSPSGQMSKVKTRPPLRPPLLNLKSDFLSFRGCTMDRVLIDACRPYRWLDEFPQVNVFPKKYKKELERKWKL
jgi:hypothetical protein